VLKDAAEKQTNIILFTGDTLGRPVRPVLDSTLPGSLPSETLNYERLLDSAMINRYDLQTANEEVQLSQTNLALQKSLRVPDVTLGANWDRAGSYINNYNSVSLSFPIPLLNRNKGNIRAAEYGIEQSKIEWSQV